MAHDLSTDVLVIGAGPAGCATAMALSARGIETLLVDRSAFPREKVCGDGLIPDALDALRTLGLEQEVRRRANVTEYVRVYAPHGSYVDLRGTCACMPRKEFDKLLVDAAVESGASMLTPYSARPLGENPVMGALLEHQESGELVRVSAKMTVLATGAGVEGITAFGVAERREPSAVALRAYFQAPPGFARTIPRLIIAYDASTSPGYGWIFPGPNDVFNVGVGCFLDSERVTRKPSLGDMFNAFAHSFAPARELLKVTKQISPLRGSPLRTAMRGSRVFRPGLLVVGEAASLTYSFTGEGIGKAMASGILAATLIDDHLRGRLPFESIGPTYAARLDHDFGSRFHGYLRAQRWLEKSFLIDYLVWRAGRSSFVRRELEGIFSETSEPGVLLSVSGAFRSLLPSW